MLALEKKQITSDGTPLRVLIVRTARTDLVGALCGVRGVLGICIIFAKQGQAEKVRGGGAIILYNNNIRAASRLLYKCSN